MSDTAAPTRLGPFDQILAAEHERNERLRHATAQLDNERTSKEDALLAEENAAVEAARAKAREELIDYKNNELPLILKDAKDQAAAEVARIERECAPRVAKAADHIVTHALSSDFSLSL